MVATFVLLASLEWAALAAALVAEEPPSPAARELMARLVAPCCWRQTIDSHDSDLAAELRREIYARVNSGESTEAIEADFARRYGERVLALRSGTDPSEVWPVLIGAALAGGLIGLMTWLRLQRRDERRRHRSPYVASVVGAAANDSRIEEELARLER